MAECFLSPRSNTVPRNFSFLYGDSFSFAPRFITGASPAIDSFFQTTGGVNEPCNVTLGDLKAIPREITYFRSHASLVLYDLRGRKALESCSVNVGWRCSLRRRFLFSFDFPAIEASRDLSSRCAFVPVATWRFRLLAGKKECPSVHERVSRLSPPRLEIFAFRLRPVNANLLLTYGYFTLLRQRFSYFSNVQIVEIIVFVYFKLLSH